MVLFVVTTGSGGVLHLSLTPPAGRPLQPERPCSGLHDGMRVFAQKQPLRADLGAKLRTDLPPSPRHRTKAERPRSGRSVFDPGRSSLQKQTCAHQAPDRVMELGSVPPAWYNACGSKPESSGAPAELTRTNRVSGSQDFPGTPRQPCAPHCDDHDRAYYSLPTIPITALYANTSPRFVP